MRLLADPARLDRGRQLAQRRFGRQVAEVVLRLARSAALAHQPSFPARQVAVFAPDGAVADADPDGGEAGGERKYYLSNLPAGTPLRALAAAIKARWVCEQAHQQLKQEPGPSIAPTSRGPRPSVARPWPNFQPYFPMGASASLVKVACRDIGSREAT